jgi:hypothetical protein
LADADFSYIEDMLHGREHRDLVFEIGQFLGRDRRKTRIPQRRHHGGVTDGKVQRLASRYVADAAAQLAAFGQGNERGMVLEEGIPGRRAFVDLPISHCVLHGFPRDNEERVLVLPAE